MFFVNTTTLATLNSKLNLNFTFPLNRTLLLLLHILQYVQYYCIYVLLLLHRHIVIVITDLLNISFHYFLSYILRNCSQPTTSLWPRDYLVFHSTLLHVRYTSYDPYIKNNLKQHMFILRSVHLIFWGAY